MQTEITKCKYYESNNSMNECFVSGRKNIEVLASDTLDSILQHFFAEIGKKDGKDYEPSFLAAIQSLIDRYIRRGGSRINFRVLPKFYKKFEHRNDVICRKIIIQQESSR